MKRFLFLIILVLFLSISFAQTQQGVVKTRGRVVNGQVVPGTRLNGATVTLNIGNPLVSGNNGTFSFNVPTGKNYSLVMAKKQGYTLADPEYTRRSFKYSASNPFFVVMEDEAQRQADINAATRKVRRTLTAQLQKREDEIEALKAQNKLTEAEYQKRLQELYDNQSKSELLVKEMAERYAATDYDQLDEFNRQVQMYIEEGELQKADSMIRTKGNMEQRVAEYHNAVATNKKLRENLKQSEAGAAKTYEDLSKDLLRRSEIFLQVFQQDSALYCLKLRADLDTTNIDCVLDYADLCNTQKAFQESEKYYLISIRNVQRNRDLIRIVRTLQNLGNLYKNMKDFTQAENYYKSALNEIEQPFVQTPDKYRFWVAKLQRAIGAFYCYTRNFKQGKYFLEQSLENIELSLKKDSSLVIRELGAVYNELGTVYNLTKDYKQAEDYYNQSHTIVEKLYQQNPNKFRYDLSVIENNMAGMYLSRHDYGNSEKFYLLSLKQCEILFKENPRAYRSDLAKAQGNVGILYTAIQDFAKSEKYLLLSLQHKVELFRLNPSVFQADLARTQGALAGLYKSLHDLEKSEHYYLLALENRQKLYEKYPQVYAEYLTATQHLLAFFYMDAKRYDDALKFIEQKIFIKPEDESAYHTKGEILLMQGRNEEALAMWKKVLELNPDFLKDYPDGTNLSNGLKKLGLIE